MRAFFTRQLLSSMPILIVLGLLCGAWVSWNWYHLGEDLRTEMNTLAEQRGSLIRSALDTAGEQGQLMGELIAADPAVASILASAESKLRETAGQATLDEERAQLTRRIATLWSKLQEKVGLNQLHFYLAPEGVALLRAQAPDAYGDHNGWQRPMVRAVFADGVARHGVDLGTRASGVRGLVPITDETGRLLAVVDVGMDTEKLLSRLAADLGIGIALLADLPGRAPDIVVGDPFLTPVAEHLPARDSGWWEPSDDKRKFFVARSDMQLFSDAAAQESTEAVVSGSLIVWSDESQRYTTMRAQRLRTTYVSVVLFLLLAMALVWGVRNVRQYMGTRIRDANTMLRAERDLYAGGAVAVLVWHDDDQRKLVYVSPNVKSLFGYTDEHMTAADFEYAELVHPDDHERVARQIEESLQQRLTSWAMTYRILRADGAERWLYDFTRAEWRGGNELVGLRSYVIDQTEHIIMQRDVAAQRRRLDSLMTSAPAVIYSAGAHDRQITYISPNFNSLLGYRISDEMRDVRWWRERVHPDDLPGVKNLDWEDWNGDQHTGIYRFLHADGTWRWLEDRCRIISDADGVPRERVGSLADVTERVFLEQRFKHEQQRAMLALAGANLGLWEWQLESDEIMFNERWAEMLGYAQHEVTRSMRSSNKMVHPEDRPRVQQALIDHLKGNTPDYQCEYRMQHKAGHWVWILDRGRVVERDASGRAVRAGGTHLDITEQHEARELLRESEEKFRSLYEYAPIGIMLNRMDDGRFLEVNDAILMMTGYTEEALLSKKFWDLTPEEFAEEEAAYFEALLGCGVYGPYEKELIHADGSRLPVQVNGTLIVDRHGDAVVWTLVQDISEQRRMEQLKNQFVSTVSHELRTPLTSIKGALGLVSGGAFGALPEQVTQMINIAAKNSERLTLLINDLLDIEKIAAGNMRFDMREQSLEPLLRQALESNKGYADEYSVTLRLDNQAGDLLVNVDTDRFLQIMANLLSNAAKFSPAGGEVTVIVTTREGQVRVMVQDQGPGVPEHFRSQIFNRFTQADSSDTRYKGGTGLGLAITREIIEHMGGYVGLETRHPDADAEKVGARFFFDLPCRSAVHPRAGDQVLVVESRPDMAMRLAALLHDADYDVDVASDVDAAMACLKDCRYGTVVVSDALPDQDAASLRAFIHEVCGRAGVTVIGITATTTKGKLILAVDDMTLLTEAGPEAVKMKEASGTRTPREYDDGTSLLVCLRRAAEEKPS
ncbi:PAS domain-containing protein [Alcanivorax sp. JB21]|nr:PAS domain-containing protein [Alcanivorax limicola]